ncbi:rod shape-determining protein MreD [Hathewaya proteolytica DSM 3090]|uniref:Rod shape-determining protein MreD n=1 Tax=Hathewaya proteolytica DSM 3090 TaxID=1121331 RepID=A0A1M6JKH9_9CLOT|nr:rod shape-determining protein MreD [Hathewaya proteolytica]SHJ47165.1 rod shape-determining protein MreD [Hathewaya proteolytica DSM 3090]
MKKNIIIVFIMVLLLIVDNSILPFLSIRGYYPSLLLVFTIFIALLSEKNEAVLFGVSSGILQDIYFNGIMGINGISNLLICLLSYYVGRSIFKEKYVMPTLTCLILSLIKGCIVFLIGMAVGMKVQYKNIFVVALYNYVIALATYKLIYKLYIVKSEKNYWKY